MYVLSINNFNNTLKLYIVYLFQGILIMRVMKAFQIQSNYQKHKQRLTNIQGYNNKRKVSCSTSKNIQCINNYKKQKLTAEIFNQKQKQSKLTHQNQKIQKHLTHIYMRQTIHKDNYKDINCHQKFKDNNNFEDNSSRNDLNKTNSVKRLTSKSSMKSLNSEQSRIRKQNQKISNKISTTKSQYTKFRETARSKSNFTKTQNQNQREEVIRLLQNQLGIKAKVAFPTIRKRKNSTFNTSNTVNKKDTQNMSESNKALNLNNNKINRERSKDNINSKNNIRFKNNSNK